MNLTDPLTQRLRDVLSTFGLNWSVNTPTRVTATTSTAIDNVITNIRNTSVSVLNTAISDHFAQEVTVNCCSPEINPPTFKLTRAVQAQNIQSLNNHLKKETWDFLNNYKCPNAMFNAFNDRLTFYLDISCPFKKIKVTKKYNKSSWITRGILTSREKLKFYYSIYIKTSNENFKCFFKNYKRIYRKVIRAAKTYDIDKTLKNCENFSKSAWKIINNLTNNQQPSTNCSKEIKVKVRNVVTDNLLEVATEFNRYFSNVAVLEPPLLGPRPCTTSVREPASSMALSPVDSEEVARVIQRLQSKKSCDVNGISMWVLKRCFKHLLAPITKLINISFSGGIFPAILKTAKVIPVFKKGDPLAASNYRPISILPVLSKVFEKVFQERFLNFLEHFDILSPQQFGFRKGKSTIDAVSNLIESVVDGLERREHVLSVFLDLSKAFDCVHHETLLHQLETCGVRGLPLKWLTSYLTGRDQCVQISHVLSTKVKMPCGVPQGSILGPVLFLIYVNGLNSSIQNGKMIQYADDTTLCIKAKTINDLEIKSLIEVNSCIQYFSEINLFTNNSKSNFINFCLRQQEGEIRPSVMVGDDVLNDTDSNKFLGMHLDRGLTWGDHVAHVCSRVTSGIYALRNLSKLCSLDILRMAYFGLIYPHMSYGIRLWGGCAKYNFERVFKLQKKAIRIISKLSYRESCRDAFRELGLLTLPCLYVLEVVMNCRSKCTLIRGSDIHHHETRGRDNFRTQQHRTAASESLPSQVGVRLINRLPEDIKQTENQNQFKARLKDLLVSKVFYSVDEFMMSRWE